MSHHRKGKHRKQRRLPKVNQREKQQSNVGLNDRKRSAWEEMFEGMTGEEIVAELNRDWVDSRYNLIIINGKGNDICDGQVIFEGWNHAEP